MEKFAIDLDKALDEFQFDRDPRERMTSVSAPIQPVGLPLQCGVSNIFHRRPVSSATNEADVTKVPDAANVKSEDVNLVEGREFLSSDIDEIRKLEIPRDNLDSIQTFYTCDQLHDDKLQPSQFVNVEETRVSSFALPNDVSQKLLQKQSSANVTAIKENNFDADLNQPFVNPTFGSVFNNLHEYVNPSSASLVNLDDINEPGETYETKRNEELVDVTDSFMKPIAKCGTDSIGKYSVDELLTAKPEDLVEDKMESNTMPPKYQNILLPIKLDTCNPEKPTKTTIVNLDEDLEFPDLLTENIPDKIVFDKPDKVIKSILDEPEHVYENVYIGTYIPKSQQVYSSYDKTRKIDSEMQHTYENVDFGPPNVSSIQHDKEGVYECIYIGNRESLPETNTELEVAAKKMADRFSLKESEIENTFANTNITLKSCASSGTKLVFQNVPLHDSEIQDRESKSIIGFTAIDNMSEEELNKYLADLEAEERANERVLAVYENISVDDIAENLKSKPLSISRDDEDANEAPIFEAVTIGELPRVPREDLREKAKKFPVIDYSKGNSAGDITKEFSCTKKTSDLSKISAQVIDDEIKIKRNKIVHEKIRKSSDNTEPIPHSSSRDQVTTNDKEGNTEKDKENGNYVTSNEVNDNRNKLDTGNLKSEENENCDNLNSTTSQIDNMENKNFDNDEHNVNNSSDNKKLMNTKTPIRNTETISRFSVTRNVDVNDKLGGRSRPSRSHLKVKTISHDTEYIENNDDDDPNRPLRPQTLDIVSTINVSDSSSAGTSCNQETSDVEGDKDSGRAPSPDVSEISSMESGTILGKQPPFWVPDSDAPNCMLCDTKFTVVKRRHHCRACGKVLCNKCCNMRYRLEYQSNVDSRVCIPCHRLLTKAESDTGSGDYSGFSNINNIGINSPQGRQPNPNNPMEYCSTIPPLQQLAGGLPPPPTVMVPVGVLKREGSTKQRSEGPKSVMFSDGIRPGCDLTELDTSWNWKPPTIRKTSTRRVGGYISSSGKKQNCPPLDQSTNSYIPHDPTVLPPTVTIHKGQVTYHDVTDITSLNTSLKNECEPPIMFVINRNLYAYVKIINLNCCVNKICWNITSKGLACVGQDEVVFLIETLPDENQVPKDLLLHINQIYHEAVKGNTISEYGMSIHQSGNLLGSREHAGFLFIRQTLQCLQKVIVPPAPFLVGLLVHRWETPWAKVFPLRLVLRLGAEYRYYPCPLVSVRFRDAVYFEIGHTIMKVLADFRNFAYTLPKVQGLTIHMQDRTTHVRFPKNRYNQVITGLNNSNDHVLAFASNFSVQADSHLVCMQTNSEDESTYQTQAINIQNKPRKVTGASFIVINGALKSSMGLSANSSILEDGLMVQIMPEKMEALKAALKNMQDFTIGCGRQGAPEPDEIVNIKWVENDAQFNLGVKSPIDGKAMDGIPSIRVHNGINFMGTSRFIRWTEVFIIKSDDDQPFGIHYPVDINKLSESIARATCTALVKLLDLLANAGLTKIAVRTTIHPDNVGYEAGSEGTRLPPIYMNSLDNELIQVLQKAVQGCEDTQTVLELVFYVLETEI